MLLQQVAVLGATGQQGGAVVTALSKRGIPVVAITRNPDSDKAKEIASYPHTIVRKADLDDAESLISAFEGCDGVFVIANFWEVLNAKREMTQYKNVTDALKKTSGIKHVIFSTLEETATSSTTEDMKTLEENETGRMTVPHYDGKARSEAYFEGLPTTFMVTSCYLENFGRFFLFDKQDDDTYTFTLPLRDQRVPWTILPDFGVLVACAFGKEELIGQRIGQASFVASGDEIATILSEAMGKVIRYNCVSWETFASFPFPGAQECAHMFEFWLRYVHARV